MVQLPAPTPTPENQRTKAALEVAEALQDIMERDYGIYASKHAVQDGGARTIPDSQPSQDRPPSTLSRRCTETSIIACRKRRYMGSLGGALEFAEGPAAQGYPAQWREEQMAWCGV